MNNSTVQSTDIRVIYTLGNLQKSLIKLNYKRKSSARFAFAVVAVYVGSYLIKNTVTRWQEIENLNRCIRGEIRNDTATTPACIDGENENKREYSKLYSYL